jgi:hypothetical protein
VRAIIHLYQSLGGDGGVLLGSGEARVPEKLLDFAQVRTHVEQVRRVAVAQAMRMHRSRDAGAPRAAPQHPAHVAIQKSPV